MCSLPWVLNMSKSCLRHNMVAQGLTDLRGIRVRKKRGIPSTMAFCLIRSGTCSVCSFLGGLIFWVMGVIPVEGKIIPPSRPNSLVVNGSAHDYSLRIEASRRDPFKRIKKRMPTPKVSKKSHPESITVLKEKDPVLRLLGVIHGQDGHQAVIQISPKERVVVQPGSTLPQSGWTIKTISEGEVVLEHLSSISSADASSPPRNYVLSFSTIRKSP